MEENGKDVSGCCTQNIKLGVHLCFERNMPYVELSTIYREKRLLGNIELLKFAYLTFNVRKFCVVSKR